jgi:hypothetical protein
MLKTQSAPHEMFLVRRKTKTSPPVHLYALEKDKIRKEARIAASRACRPCHLDREATAPDICIKSCTLVAAIPQRPQWTVQLARQGR